MRLRNSLLVGVAFLAGVACLPASSLVRRALGPDFGIPAAFADNANSSGAKSGADTYRLLGLFGDVFERVRADYVDPVTSKTLIYNALNGMLSGLDPHSDYMDPTQYNNMQVQTRGQFGGLGLEVTEEDGFIKVVTPIDGTPAAKAGIKSGDLIVALNGKTVQGLTLTDAVNRMRGSPGSKLTLTIKRMGDNNPVEVTLTREIIHIDVVHDKLYGDIGYIRLAEFDQSASSGIRKAIAKLKQESHGRIKGYILDLRNNPGGLLDQAVAVANDFMGQGEIVSTRGRHAEDDQRWDAAAGNDIVGKAPLVVMINNGTASAAEIVSGALKDNRRAVLLGTRSFGKGSVQTVIPLPGNNGAIRLTTARYYTPSGRSIQGLGITPDVHVAETREAVPEFGPAHESDLNHVISNTGGVPPAAKTAPRTDLPPIAKEIPARPPKDWPKYDASKSSTDFQLQQALKLAGAMVKERTATMH
ncbi:MAG: S41 family peptidase [Acetobacteraceae bacterium]